MARKSFAQSLTNFAPVHEPKCQRNDGQGNQTHSFDKHTPDQSLVHGCDVRFHHRGNFPAPPNRAKRLECGGFSTAFTAAPDDTGSGAQSANHDSEKSLPANRRSHSEVRIAGPNHTNPAAGRRSDVAQASLPAGSRSFPAPGSPPDFSNRCSPTIKLFGFAQRDWIAQKHVDVLRRRHHGNCTELKPLSPQLGRATSIGTSSAKTFLQSSDASGRNRYTWIRGRDRPKRGAKCHGPAKDPSRKC
jgi:hypothetical protein